MENFVDKLILSLIFAASGELSRALFNRARTETGFRKRA